MSVIPFASEGSWMLDTGCSISRICHPASRSDHPQLESHDRLLPGCRRQFVADLILRARFRKGFRRADVDFVAEIVTHAVDGPQSAGLQRVIDHVGDDK